MSQNVLKLLNEFESDVCWFKDNLDRLKVEHDNEFVAIKDCQVVDFDADVKRLIAKLKRKGIDAGDTMIQFISSIPTIY